MSHILKSASKLVLILVSLTMSVAFLIGVLREAVDYEIITIAYIGLMNALTGFYFANKGDNNKK